MPCKTLEFQEEEHCTGDLMSRSSAECPALDHEPVFSSENCKDGIPGPAQQEFDALTTVYRTVNCLLVIRSWSDLQLRFRVGDKCEPDVHIYVWGCCKARVVFRGAELVVSLNNW